ncbi:MAG TPA: SH3 domain-containing protein [Candidatus Avipropionibacterium avicola]|uniref:SH3 domain-containing protein n=1 Tax=Candidatus Avipropionibacterium avicola TaxID=2840701 RepID=A0A9D1KNL9_9ACTN|nr:SH3 domain-containing protein [Candidatus Avipropionibacterium avicola]
MTKRAAKPLRRLVGAVAAAGLVAGIAATAVVPSANADADKLTTWTAVNIRSGPGTNYKLLGGLYPGQLITPDGPSQNGWTPVKWNGKRAWVSSQYVRVAGSGKASSKSADSTTASGKAGSMATTTALNVRTGPSTSYRVYTVLGSGTKVTTTGAYKNGFAEIKYSGGSYWVATQYLRSGGSGGSGSNLPKVTGTRVATTALMIRTNSTANFQNLGDVPKGTKLSITGVTKNGVAQIVYNGAVRWVNAAYLAKASSGPSPADLPKATGTRYATTALMIRTTSTASFKNLGDVPTGTKLSVTGVTKNGVAQIVYKGAIRWVNAAYLSSTKPAKGTNISGIAGNGLSGLTSRSKALLVQVHSRYPQITWYNGVRPDSLPDHPSGRALDIMLSNYKSAASNQLGWQIANWAKANAASLGVEYIIFDQKIWSVARSGEGWRTMADRGSDNQNHKNHVHITTKP